MNGDTMFIACQVIHVALSDLCVLEVALASFQISCNIDGCTLLETVT